MSKIYQIIKHKPLGQSYMEYAGKTAFPLIKMVFNIIHAHSF